jgi:hypothetical protein
MQRTNQSSSVVLGGWAQDEPRSVQDPRQQQPLPAATGEDQQRPVRPPRRRIFRGPQTVEAYLRANAPPRYMERLREIETEYRTQLRQLQAAYGAEEDASGGAPELFSARWRVRAQGWSFDRLNELVREHNAWYPVEANLPMDPRTRDYVAIRGASYRRAELGPEWILEHFPPGCCAQRPPAPRRAPRESI